MNLLDAITDGALLGGAFAGPTWAPWRTFVKVIDALPLSADDRQLFEQCTGRTVPPSRRVTEVYAIVGRRGGKSRLAAALAIEAACLVDWSPYLAVGERPVVACVAADRQAGVVMNYVRGLLLATPLLAQTIVRETDSVIELANGVSIEVTTCSARTTRGYSFCTVVADELAFWRSESSSEPDVEVLAAVRPGMSTLPGARLVCISSPYARSGALWQAYKTHHGRDDDPVLTWVAPSLTMNPSLDPAVVAAAYERDPASAGAEFGAQFRVDVEGFVSREVLDACVVPGRLSLPRLRDHEYVAFVDPSGGSQDSFTVAVAHAEREAGQVIAVLDAVEERRPPFSPEAVVREFAETVKRYGCHLVTGDRYAGEWPREQFRKHGVEYVPSEKPKSDLYRETLPMFSSGRVRLLDLPRLIMQLLNLERRTARGGKDSIDHAPHAHDDVANAAAGALVTAAGGATNDFEVLSANVNPERNRRVLDDGEMQWMRRIV